METGTAMGRCGCMETGTPKGRFAFMSKHKQVMLDGVGLWNTGTIYGTV